MSNCKSLWIKVAIGFTLLVTLQLVVIGYAISSIEKAESITELAASPTADKNLVAEEAAMAHEANQELVDSLMIYAKGIAILLLCVVAVIHRRLYASDDEGNRYGAQDQSQTTFAPTPVALSPSPSFLSGAKPIPIWLPGKCPFYTFVFCGNCRVAAFGRAHVEGAR